jgi:hypothetical protein
MHVAKQNRKSLDDEAAECILVGDGIGSTYRLMTIKSRRTVVARDVKFDEASLRLRDVKNDYVPPYLESEYQEDIRTP